MSPEKAARNCHNDMRHAPVAWIVGLTPHPRAGGTDRIAVLAGQRSLALRTSADEGDRDVELALDELDVGLRCGRQRGRFADAVERLPPPGQRLIDGSAVVEVALVRGKLVRLRPVAQAVAGADRQLVER